MVSRFIAVSIALYYLICATVVAWKISSPVKSSLIRNIVMTKPDTTIPPSSKIEVAPFLTASLPLLMFPLTSFASDTDLAVITTIRPVIDIFVNVLSLLFICRTVLSWYPKTDLKKFPYIIAAWPTEPLLQPVRGLVPPAFGVDISAIVWIMLLSFLREILTGQQGILTLMERG